MSLDWLADAGLQPDVHARLVELEAALWTGTLDPRILHLVRARTAQLMKDGNGDVRKLGGIDLPTMQKYLNLWYSLSLDLFGGEVSSNAASFFASGLKGRAHEEKEFTEHTALNQTYASSS